MNNGGGQAVCWQAHAWEPPPIAGVSATPHSSQHRRVGPIAHRAAHRRRDIMRPRTIFLRLSETLPRHWTPADANGARRWGLSFGAGLLLFTIVGVFGAYMAIDERQGGDDAWNRSDVGRIRRSFAPASDAAPVSASSADFASLPSPIPIPVAQEASAAAAAKPPTNADRTHGHGHVLGHGHGRDHRHPGAHRRRHPSHITITPAPDILFTLPHFQTEPLRMPVAPRSPSAPLNVSDNQHELYRGH